MMMKMNYVKSSRRTVS